MNTFKATVVSVVVGLIVVLSVFGILSVTGCAARQANKLASVTSVPVKTSYAPIQQESTVDKNVIAIEVKEIVNANTGETKVVYEEKFEQPTIVVRGASPGKVFLPDGRTVPQMAHCLTWTDKNGNLFSKEISANARVVYIFPGVVEQVAN